MTASDLTALTITEAAARIRRGELTSVALVTACLDRIAEREPQVEAWTFLDRALALKQAEAADRSLKEGKAGPLQGVPIAIKDIFDTADMPTENGSPFWAGRTPRHDSTAVARLRAAGAVIMGKTVTTECAYYSPGKTKNPHNPAHTPGGSSSGSAAAVGAGMVPGALGSQTNGSVIRPASFCGVVGYKPSHGLIPRTGVLALSHTLDHVGVFARTVADAGLLAETLAGSDGKDTASRPLARPRLAEVAGSAPPYAPRFAFVKTPAWTFAEPSLQAALGAFRERLGAAASEVELGPAFDHCIDYQRALMETDMTVNLAEAYTEGKDKLSPVLLQLMERGRVANSVEYLKALSARGPLNAALEPVFERYDAIVTGAAPGAAPHGLGATGNPVFCSMWTYLGTPAVTVPLAKADNGLPIGVQLIGRHGDDARLLRTANWVADFLTGRG